MGQVEGSILIESDDAEGSDPVNNRQREYRRRWWVGAAGALGPGAGWRRPSLSSPTTPRGLIRSTTVSENIAAVGCSVPHVRWQRPSLRPLAPTVRRTRGVQQRRPLATSPFCWRLLP